MSAELSVADLRFAYTRGAEELFDGLTHRFTPGAVTALTGPSGRGKSTLLYVLGLMLTPSGAWCTWATSRPPPYRTEAGRG
ncbi:ATP-binding protein [Micrococcus luteus]|uniref:ATP-binding protein n=1 Tax=Micrococcus luteus TaxID=1270 RepID=UPI003879C5BF